MKLLVGDLCSCRLIRLRFDVRHQPGIWSLFKSSQKQATTLSYLYSTTTGTTMAKVHVLYTG